MPCYPVPAFEHNQGQADDVLYPHSLYGPYWRPSKRTVTIDGIQTPYHDSGKRPKHVVQQQAFTRPNTLFAPLLYDSVLVWCGDRCISAIHGVPSSQGGAVWIADWIAANWTRRRRLPHDPSGGFT